MKNTLFTRLLSLALTVLMIASMLSFGVSATDDPSKTPVVDWKSDSTNHWQLDDEGKVVNPEKHTPVPAWSSDGKTHWRECSVCGCKTNEAKCTEGADGLCENCFTPVAQHAVANKWVSDSDNHWKSCTKCGKKVDVAAHEEGKDGSCTVCGTYVHVHEASELKKDSTGHWLVCECGKMVDEEGKVVTKKTAHVDENNDGMCDDADCKYHSKHVAKEGEWTQTKTEHYQFCVECNTVLNRDTHKYGDDKICDTCGYDSTVAHTCTPNPNWSYDKENHWHACACGEVEFNKVNHTMENGKCTICGYSGTCSIPVTPGCSHSYCVGRPNCYHGPVCTTKYVIYATSSVGGVISHEGRSDVPAGNSLTYTFTPMVGYVVSKVIVDGVNVGRTSVYTFNKIRANHTIHVVFQKVACTGHANCTSYPYCSHVFGCKLHDCCIGYTYCIAGTACKTHDCCKGYPYCIYQPSYSYKPGCTTHPGCYGYSCCIYNVKSYSISASATAGGKLSPAGNAVIVAGNSMTYKFTPNDGYIISKVYVDGKDVGKVSSYTFEKVKSNHTLRVVFEKMTMPFFDVYSTDWYYEDVRYVYNNEIMQGTSYKTFSPKDNITRAMIVTMLWRLEGSPASVGAQFKDVAENSYYAAAVRWAAKNGIVVGDDVGTFRPDDNINREELAVILYRYAKLKGDGFEGNWAYKLSYTDLANISSWALEAVSYFSMKNIIVTDSAVMLNPTVFATRAEAAVVLHRLCEFLAK